MHKGEAFWRVSVVVLAFCLLLMWVRVFHVLSVHRDRLYLRRAISVGMSREAVISRLGRPNSVAKDSELIKGESEILVYGSWRNSLDDVWVIFNEDGRVASVFYPDLGGIAIGGIAVGASETEPSRRGAGR